MQSSHQYGLAFALAVKTGIPKGVKSENRKEINSTSQKNTVEAYYSDILNLEHDTIAGIDCD